MAARLGGGRARPPGRARPSAEAQLVAELKSHQPDAWAALYDAHYRQLYRYAFVRVGGDRETAEDLAATVFSRALTAIDSYSYAGDRCWPGCTASPGTW